MGTHPPEPLSPHLDDPAPRFPLFPRVLALLICLIPAIPTTPVIIPTTQWLAGLLQSVLSFIFLFLVFKMLLLYRNILRSGQILWIRGLTRLQTQVGGAREEIFCALQNVFQFSVKVEQHFTLDNFVCQLCWMTRILQTIFCIKQCLE